MQPDDTPKHTNRLIDETSPYLLAHAHNPVNWYPWSTEALKLAKEQNKPILLSIGYSACHWCHVMERESFEHVGIAKLMNDAFICIKVDREERPDLDEIYMTATTALNHGQGGWPMTVFLTPNQEPFFAGTYFPPTDHYGRPGFPKLLTQIAQLWEKHQDQLVEQARQLTTRLTQESEAAPQSIPFAVIEDVVKNLHSEFDSLYGGFGSAPKFPPSTTLSLLLRHHQQSGSKVSLDMVCKTLDAMAQGGMYDHLAGGFARYSTDAQWLVPHFEKMLYDNALLVKIYLEAYQVTQNPTYAKVARETLDFVIEDMTSPEGGYYSAYDADSEGEEGKYYVWDLEQITTLLDTKAANLFCAFYDISPAGNWQGQNILNTPKNKETIARELQIAIPELEESLNRSKTILLKERQKRIPPGLDDKVLSAWNGLMVGAMAYGFSILDDRKYFQSASLATQFILKTLRKDDGRLLRTYRAGKAHIEAFLEDYAFLCEALIDLYEASGSKTHLEEALSLAQTMLRDFHDEQSGAFYHTAHQHEKLISRKKEGHDGAIPNANATAALSLVRLSHHLNKPHYGDLGRKALEAYGISVQRFPRAFAKTLCAVDFFRSGPTEIALVGDVSSPDFAAFKNMVFKTYLPNKVIQLGVAGTKSLALLENQPKTAHESTAYFCKNYTCEVPIHQLSQLENKLKKLSQKT